MTTGSLVQCAVVLTATTITARTAVAQCEVPQFAGLSAEFDGEGDILFRAVGDLNGDGRDDLVHAVRDSPMLVIRLATENGDVSRTHFTIRMEPPDQVRIADIDRDRDNDLIVRHRRARTMSWYTNDGTGSFVLTGQLGFDADLEPLEIADLDGDHDPDLILELVEGQAIRLARNLGGGRFALVDTGLPAYSGSFSLSAGDVLRDQRNLPDLIVADRSGSAIDILRNDGRFRFTLVQTFLLDEAPRGARPADVDLDGNVDVVTWGAASVSLAMASASDGLVDLIRLDHELFDFASGIVQSVVVDDFDNDGDPDMAAEFNSMVVVLTNNTIGPDIDVVNGPYTLGQRMPTSHHHAASAAIGRFGHDLFVDVMIISRDPRRFSLWHDALRQRPLDAIALRFGYASLVGAAVADLDLDGHVDLASVAGTQPVASNLVVHYGTTSGGIPEVASYASGPEPRTPMSADVDADGYPDLIVPLNQFSPNVIVLRNNHDRSYTAMPVPFIWHFGRVSEAVPADLNGDGLLDIAAAYWNTDQFGVFRGHGDGTFDAPVLYGTGARPVSIDAADVDRDGDMDLVIACRNAGIIAVHQNLIGAGIYPGFTGYSPPGGFYQLEAVRTGDFNEDGYPDIVAASHEPDSGKVPVFFNDGAGRFDSTATFDGFDWPYALALGDVNLDGHLDLAVSNRSDDFNSLLLGSGDGTFPVRREVMSFGRSFAVSLADVDRDGRIDLVTSDLGFVMVNHQLNCPTDLSAGDANSDGIINVTDLLLVVRMFGLCPGDRSRCPADLDGDGLVGIADLLILLANWSG